MIDDAMGTPLDGEAPVVRRALLVLGQMLTGTAEPKPTADRLLAAHLGAPRNELSTHYLSLTPSTLIAAGLVLADLVDQHNPVIGPDEDDDPPSWREFTLGGVDYSIPTDATLFFGPHNPFGSGPLAVQAVINPQYNHHSIAVIAPPGGHEMAKTAVAQIRRRMTARNPLRGRVLNAGFDGRLQLSVEDVELGARRDDVVVPETVWREVDLAVAAVTTRHETLRAAGLATSRGIMLAGPPGVGKTAVARVVMSELVGSFTAIIADPASTAHGIGDIYRTADDLGPLVVLLDDIDLHIKRRGSGSDSSLGSLLSALDGATKRDRVLTIATTNDPKSLDNAATRAARFDSIVEMGWPTDAAVAAMLRSTLRRLPSADVDVARVVDAFPAERTGADVSEAIRRAVLVDGEAVTTATLLSVIGERGYAATVPIGTYL
ncbi:MULTISPECIES: AAA family ATPase [unclassified Gordonia (in: high G+C Gram-positive bacteria)]|uniref:ATP-binding protein n=1 Tax=Gordonia sp. B7-2 TaxID=3420932 RepID=UPI003D90FE81